MPVCVHTTYWIWIQHFEFSYIVLFLHSELERNLTKLIVIFSKNKGISVVFLLRLVAFVCVWLCVNIDVLQINERDATCRRQDVVFKAFFNIDDIVFLLETASTKNICVCYASWTGQCLFVVVSEQAFFIDAYLKVSPNVWRCLWQTLSRILLQLLYFIYLHF